MTKPFQTVRTILHQILAMHQSQRGSLSKRAQLADNPFVEAVVAYLGRREEDLVALLGRYEGTGDAKLLDTPVQSPPESAMVHAVEADAEAKYVDDPAALIRTYLQRDEALQEVYEQLSGAFGGPKLHDAFRNLAMVAKEERKRLSYMLSVDDQYGQQAPGAEERSRRGDK